MKVNQQSRHRVLVVAAELGHNSQREIAGISSFVRRAGLAVDVVDGSRFGDTPDFAKWIEFWNPGGLIVDPKYAVAVATRG